jgi:hypothetical protein
MVGLNEALFCFIEKSLFKKIHLSVFLIKMLKVRVMNIRPFLLLPK